MKQCPVCKNVFADNLQTFCLMDGTLLVYYDEPGPQILPPTVRTAEQSDGRLSAPTNVLTVETQIANRQFGGYASNIPFTPPLIAGIRPKSDLAVVSLTLGILSILFLPVTGPVAVILGYKARTKALTNPMEFGGSGLALAGMITGGIGTGIMILILIIVLMRK